MGTDLETGYGARSEARPTLRGKGGVGPPSGGGSGGVRAMCLRAVGLGDDLSSFSCADKGLVLFTLLVGCYEIVAFAVPALLRSAGGPMASEPVSGH